MSTRPYCVIADDVVAFLPVDQQSTVDVILARMNGAFSDVQRFVSRADDLGGTGGFTPAEAALAHLLAELMRLETLHGVRISDCLEAMTRAYDPPH